MLTGLSPGGARVLAATLFLSAGCSIDAAGPPHASPGDSDVVTMQALVMVHGVREADEEMPRSLVVRLVFANRGRKLIKVARAGFVVVVTGEAPLGQPLIDADGELQMAPGEPLAITLLFPIDEGLSEEELVTKGLHVSWTVQEAGGPEMRQTASFEGSDPEVVTGETYIHL